ncbi:hypothetical protein [Streptomyces sp. NPDC003006]
MHRTPVALLAASALALASCSSAADSEPPKATATVIKTPSLSATEQREACVDAWSNALQKDADTDLDQEPAECDGLREDDQMDRYMEGLQKRNAINRGDVQECLDDPPCTSLPIP